MKASALVLSNNVLYRGRRDKVKISPMKLQKLLYYVCVMYAKRTGVLPISEHFEVWKSGPVLPSVHSEYDDTIASKLAGTLCTTPDDEDFDWNSMFIELPESLVRKIKANGMTARS